MSKQVSISFLGMHLVNSQVCNTGQEVWNTRDKKC